MRPACWAVCPSVGYLIFPGHERMSTFFLALRGYSRTAKDTCVLHRYSRQAAAAPQMTPCIKALWGRQRRRAGAEPVAAEARDSIQRYDYASRLSAIADGRGAKALVAAAEYRPRRGRFTTLRPRGRGRYDGIASAASSARCSCAAPQLEIVIGTLEHRAASPCTTATKCMALFSAMNCVPPVHFRVAYLADGMDRSTGPGAVVQFDAVQTPKSRRPL